MISDECIDIDLDLQDNVTHNMTALFPPRRGMKGEYHSALLSSDFDFVFLMDSKPDLYKVLYHE